MPRKRLPGNVLDARGSFVNHPERRRNDEPQPGKPLGSPPKHLDVEAKRAWRDITRHCIPGVLADSDALAVEMCAYLLAEFREDSRAFSAAKLQRLHSLLGDFGMTPADRSRVAVYKKPEAKNDWADF